MKFKIELIEIGRSNHSEVFEKEFLNIDKAEEFALRQSSKYLLSKEIELVHEQGIIYSIIVGGFRVVGKIKIEEIKK